MDMRFLELPRYVYRETTDYEAFIEYGEHWPFAVSQLYKNYLRTVLSERQNHKCCYCGLVMNDTPNSRRQVSLEHVIPDSKGGPTDLWNCVVAHRRCNTRRQDNYIPEEKLVVFGLTNDQQFVQPYFSDDSEGDDMTVPVERGRAAFRDGIPVTDNPYRAGTMFSIHWHIAWLLCQAFSSHKPLDS